MGRKGNQRDMILEEAGDEPIRFVVIGKRLEYWGEEDGVATCPIDLRSKILTWNKAAPILDIEVDTGYGSIEGFAFTAWTDTRVLFWAEYDGAQSVASLPRNPTEGSACEGI